MAYNVVLSKFEGPLDLLLHLVEKSKLSIYDINISEITEQYLDYINHMRKIDLEISSEFIVMAATLLEIKSKSLLPVYQSNDNSEAEHEKEQLIQKLIEYKKFKQVCQLLRELELQGSKIFYRNVNNISKFKTKKIEIKPVDINYLYLAYKNLMDNVKASSDERKKFSYIKSKMISISKMILKLKLLLKKYKRINFNKYFLSKFNRSEIIVSFLAVLELCAKNKITITQNKLFDNIIIEYNNTKKLKGSSNSGTK